MAHQKVSNKRKKELEQIDPFQESMLRAMAYAKTYRKQISLILVAVIATFVIFSGIIYSIQKGETEAAEKLTKVLEDYAVANDPVKGYEAVEKTFDTLIKEYANTEAGKIAKARFGKICLDASKPDRALPLFEESLKDFKGNAHMTHLLYNIMAVTYEALGKPDQARDYYLKIHNAENGLMKNGAAFALGMLYDESGDKAESRQFFEEAAKGDLNPIYRSIAESKLDGGARNP